MNRSPSTWRHGEPIRRRARDAGLSFHRRPAGGRTHGVARGDEPKHEDADLVWKRQDRAFLSAKRGRASAPGAHARARTAPDWAEAAARAAPVRASGHHRGVDRHKHNYFARHRVSSNCARLGMRSLLVSNGRTNPAAVARKLRGLLLIRGYPMTDLRTRLLDAFQGVHEKPIDYPQWGITGVLLREFTARERQAANEAVTLENATDPDQILYRAMLLQRCITDPGTGKPYADGRTDLSTGQPAIDPRTRTPVFTVEDVQSLADGRSILFNILWDELLEVAGMTSAGMFSRGDAADGSERSAGAGAAGVDAAHGEPADLGTGDADERAAHADGADAADGPPNP